jgi:flagellar hook-length control protein FliK
MINFFSMIPAANLGMQISGGKLAAGNMADANNGLFATVLQKINGASGNVDTSKGLTLLLNSAVTDMATGQNNSDAKGIAAGNNTGSKTSKTSVQSQDLMLTEAAASQLIAFLKAKGFSSDQIDKMMLSSTNTEGMVQIDKLVAAMASTEKTSNTGTTKNQAYGTGLVIESSSIPKVQETLFKMGLGIGEVKSTIENSINQDGTLSLDKLAGSLKAVTTENFSKAELASLLAQNNVAVKTQAPGVADASQASETAIKSMASDISIKSGNADTSSTTDFNLEPVVNRQINDIKEAVSDFKKEFTSFVHGSSPDNAGQKTAALHKISIQTQEITSANNKLAADSDVKGADISKAFATTSTPETNQSLNQASPKGQAKWQKSVEGKIINILSSKDQAASKTDENGLDQLKTDMIPAFKDTLKQGDHNLKQEIISAVAADNSGSATHGAEIIKDLQNGKDAKSGMIDFKETSVAGLNAQNMAKVSEAADPKSQTKTVYNLPEPLPKVLDKMVVMIKNGEQSGKLIIQPPELGKIDINLTIKDGNVQAHLNTENYAVKQIIETNLNQLKQQLTDQGLTIEQFSVSVGSQHKQFADDNSKPWNGKGSESSESGITDISDVSSIMSDINGMNGQYRIDVHV